MARGGGGGKDIEDLVGLLILGAGAYFVYTTYYPGKSVDEVIKDVDSKITQFLGSLNLSLSSLKFPTFPPPSASASAFPQPSVPFTPPTPTRTPTSTISTDTEPKTIESSKKPKGSGQLTKNPDVGPPPTGSGGAIVAFAGDFSGNSTARQTVDVMEKNNVSFIVGTGDYSYGGAAPAWFDQIIGARYKGKMVGAQGNHDNDSFLAVFGMSKWNDAFKVAPNLSVVTIDTEGGISAGELDTLTTKAKGMGTKHVAYVQHKPHITSSDAHHKSSENKSGSVIEAAVKKHGIKLVASGHNHVYEHFFCSGTHYVTSGVGGRDFYKTGCKACSPVKCINSTNGFLKVGVGASLICQFVSNSNQVLDSFTIA